MFHTAVQHEPDGVWVIAKYSRSDDAEKAMQNWEEWCEKMDSYCETRMWTRIAPPELREARDNDQIVYADEFGRV